MTIADFIVANAPALLVAIPLFAAFLCPVMGKISTTARNIWVMGMMLVTAAVAFILAYQVFATGTIVYVFGAAAANLTVPLDSGVSRSGSSSPSMR
jgi:multicomponent Na+:H+ antiporter subunit D